MSAFKIFTILDRIAMIPLCGFNGRAAIAQLNKFPGIFRLLYFLGIVPSMDVIGKHKVVIHPVVAGDHGSSDAPHIYRNDAGTFVDHGATLINADDGACAWGDL